MTMRERIAAAVADRLAPAAPGVAKDEIIEELSGNLYAKYQDLVGAGVDPEEAFGAAMDSLGDVDDLIDLAGGSRTRAELERALEGMLSAVKGAAREFKEPVKEMVDDLCHVAQVAKEPLKDVGRAIAGAFKDLGLTGEEVQDAQVEPVDGENAPAAADGACPPETPPEPSSEPSSEPADEEPNDR